MYEHTEPTDPSFVGGQFFDISPSAECDGTVDLIFTFLDYDNAGADNDFTMTFTLTVSCESIEWDWEWEDEDEDDDDDDESTDSGSEDDSSSSGSAENGAAWTMARFAAIAAIAGAIFFGTTLTVSLWMYIP